MKGYEARDEEIAKLVQGGDRSSFRILVERYEPKMIRYARRFLFGNDDAKDLVQEVFIKAYVNIQGFHVKQRFSPWLYRIAHNEFVNALKKREREKRNISIFDLDILFPHLAVAKETADGDLHRAEIKRMLDRSLDTLSAKYREPLVLYYFEEMDYRAIADVLRIPIATVGVRLGRGRAMLRKIIEQ